MKNRILIAVIAIVSLIALCGCGADGQENTEPETTVVSLNEVSFELEGPWEKASEETIADFTLSTEEDFVDEIIYENTDNDDVVILEQTDFSSWNDLDEFVNYFDKEWYEDTDTISMEDFEISGHAALKSLYFMSETIRYADTWMGEIITVVGDNGYFVIIYSLDEDDAKATLDKVMNTIAINE